MGSVVDDDANTRSTLWLRLYGPFAALWTAGDEIDLRSAKTKAMLALLATAPDGKRSRSWLQEMLWSYSDPEHGRASLRQTLSALRRTLGDRFEAHLLSTNDTVRLRLGTFEVVGTPSDGVFLEGIDVRSEGFESWLRDMRACEPANAPLNAPFPNALRASGPSALARLRPAVAIVPFRSVVDDPGLQAAGDVIAQDVTRALSRSPLFDVICHLSTRSLPIDTVDVPHLRDYLDVDFIVCGSVRGAPDRYRLDVDFVDAATGRLNWSQAFDGDRNELSVGLPDVVPMLAEEIALSIAGAVLEPVARQSLTTVETHLLMMAGITLMHRVELGSFSRARSCLEEVARRLPRYAEVHAWLAKWYVLSVQQGWSTDHARDSQTARAAAATAREINPGCPIALTMDGLVHGTLLKDRERSGALFDEAVVVDPNNALACLLKGTQYAFVDDGPSAVTWTRRARRLSPLDPQRYLFDALSSAACLANEDYEGALAFADSSLRINRRHTSSLRARIVALQLLGREEEARETTSDLMRRDPDLTIERYLRTHPAAEFNTGQSWARALKKAGVPER